MFFDGNIEVLSALKKKRSLVHQDRPHSHIRPLLLVCGGVMRGVYGGGAVMALEASGYADAFDVVVGLSTGSPTASYFLSRQSELGTRIYSEECCTRDFIDFFRFTQICSVGYLLSVFADSQDKRLDTAKVFANRSKLFIGVTEHKTAQQYFFTPRTNEELFSLIGASVSMPGLCSTVPFRGGEYLDGSSSDPLPIERLIKVHSPTHVLVIANRARAYDDRTPLLEQLLYETVLRSKLSKPMRNSLRERRALMSEKFRWIKDSSPIPVLVGWGDTRISSFTRNPYLLRDAALRSYESWMKILGGQQ